MAGMQARFATQADVREIVRLAGIMYTSMGLDGTDPEWVQRAEESLGARLGVDVQVAVVDHPDGTGPDRQPRLAASGAAVVSQRLPGPITMTGRVAYLQWVATEEQLRGRGLGRSVMELLLDWCAEQAIPVVELHATALGEPLYRSLGFSQEGPRPLRRVSRPAPAPGD